MKKALTILLTAVIMFSVCPLGLFTFTASAETDGYYTYTVSDGEATITAVDTSISGAVTIPSTLGGYPVTGIGSSAFSGCSGLASVDIPNSVTTIGVYAFANCVSLDSVDFGSGVTYVGSAAFDYCDNISKVYISDLKAWCETKFYDYSSSPLIYAGELYLNGIKVEGTVSIPEGTTQIGDFTFHFCESITAVSIPDTVVSIGEDAFAFCKGLTSINIPYSVTGIGDRAFYSCDSLTDITIPDGITSIGTLMFGGCDNLVSVVIPESITDIGDAAFSGCKSLEVVNYGGTEATKKEITISSSNTYLENATWKYGTPYLKYSYDSENLLATVIGCNSSPRNVTIPSTVLRNGSVYTVVGIGDSVFENHTSLKSISIPGSVTSIGCKAFLGCSSLESITLPYSLIRIDSSTFGNCKALKRIVIPANVQSIASGNPFFGCSSVEELIVSAGNQHYYSKGNCIIEKESGLVVVGCKASVIPHGVTGIGYYAFGGITIDEINIPKSVVSIDEYAFSLFGGSELERVYYNGTEAERSELLGSTVLDCAVWYYNYATYEYDYLTYTATVIDCDASKPYIYIPDTVVKYGNQEFTVTAVGHYSFENNTTLEGVAIADSVKIIYDDAFYGCTNLNFVRLPHNETTIGDNAFYGCTNLHSIVIPDEIISIGDSAFEDCENLGQITVGCGVKSIGYRAFYNTLYYNSDYMWENGVLYIGGYLIEAKTTLADDYSVKEGTFAIADNAFSNCSITSIFVPDSVHGIGVRIFEYCDNLESITVDIGNNVYHSVDNCIIETNTKTLIAGCKNSVIPSDGSVISIAACAFYGCSGLVSVVIPEGVISTGDSAFYGCYDLVSIVIADSVTEIGSASFANTKYYLDSGNWQNNVLYISNHLVKARSSISGSYNIKEGTLTIAGYAFYNCNNFTAVVIPDSVKTIGDGAFSECANLAHVKIGDGVTRIGQEAFFYTAYYYNDENWHDNVLYIDNHLIRARQSSSVNVVIKEGTLTVGDGAFYYCYNLKSVSIPNSVKTIGDYAFYTCYNLTEINIPNSVTSIGDNAFDTCVGINSIVMGDSVTSIGENAFDNCTNLTVGYYIGTRSEWKAIDISDIGNSYLLNAHIYFNWSGVVGDFDGDSGVSGSDAVFLLYNTLFGDEEYPVGQNCDLNGDGAVAEDDAVYLLYHALFGELYPLG